MAVQPAQPNPQKHGLEHAFSSDNPHQKRDIALGVGAATLGVKGGSYVKGAAKLRKLDPEHAARISHALNNHPIQREGLQWHMAHQEKLADPTFLHREKNKSIKGIAQHNSQIDPKDFRHAGKAADHWADTFAGVKQSRNVADKKVGAMDALNFNHRPRHAYLSRIIEHSGPSNVELHRGMALPKELKVGDEIHLHQSSWTQEHATATRFAAVGSTPKVKDFIQARGMPPNKVQHHMVLPKGERATNISGLTRTVQQEHVTPAGKYRVKEINARGHHIMERVEKRNLTQPQINRRKKAGAELGRASATAGLGSLGLLAASKGRPKLKVAALNLGVIGGGISGINGFNNASWQSAEAKQRKKAVVVTASKSASPFEEGTYGEIGKAVNFSPGMGAMRPSTPTAAKFKPLGQRPVSANVKNMRKVPLANGGGPSGGGGGGVGNTAGLSGVGKSYDEIEKLGSPKVRYQEINGYEQDGNTTTKHPADKVTAHYKGKSMILRRPKYQAVGSPSNMEDKKFKSQGQMHVSVTPNMRLNAEGGRRIDAAYKGKKKKVNLGMGDAKFAIGKDADFGAFND